LAAGCHGSQLNKVEVATIRLRGVQVAPRGKSIEVYVK
jgi:hypothetical protein